MSAFLNGYTTRIRLTIDHTKVGETLTNFPVLVKLTSADLSFANANSDGFDFRFTSDDGYTLLKYERERHDAANSLAEYWVKIPSVSSSVDTVFFLYYRTTDTADGADAANVWDANYVGVWHLNDITTSTVDDSTTLHDMTKKGANEPIEAAGMIGKGQDFDGTDDYITTANDPYSNTNFASGMTVSVLFKTADAAYQYLLDDEGYSNMGLSLSGNKNKLFCTNNGGASFVYSSADMNDDAWHVAVMIWDGTTNSNLYIDGAYVGAVASADPRPDIKTRPFAIGSHSTLLNPFHGLIDETRISKVARSAAYVKADYHSCFDTLLTKQTEILNAVKIAIGGEWKDIEVISAKMN